MSNREAPFLHFYGKNGIIPTHLEVPDIAKFYLIRDRLFETIGVAPSLIKGCDILEVGPGSGEKSMTLTLGHFLSLGAMLFALAVIGIFLNRKNLIVLLMAIELMLLAVNMNFVAFSHYLDDMHGQVFVFFILTVAAAESAIGLAILVLLFRNKSSINAEDLNTLKG